MKPNLGTLLLVVVVLAVLLLRYAGALVWTPWKIVGSAIFLPAFLLFVLARIELGRAFSIKAKASTLVTTGIYARIRNPIYVFGGLMSVGIFIFVHRPWWLLQVMMLALAVILVDQASKRWIQTPPERNVALGSMVRIHCVVNRNRIYQRAGSRIALAALWPIALTSAAVLYGHGLYFRSALGLPGLAVAFAGSASNLADILRRRAIVDFVDLGWWPAFNVADIAIVVGLAAAFYP